MGNNLPPIQVLTLDGRLPKDGGLRVGYRVGNKVFPIVGQPFSLLPPVKQEDLSTEMKERTRDSVIRYDQLPRALNFDGKCRCGRPRNQSQRLMTDVSWRDVIVCECGREMRPYQPSFFSPDPVWQL